MITLSRIVQMQTVLFIKMLQPLVSKALVISSNFLAPFTLVFDLGSCDFIQREVSLKKVSLFRFSGIWRISIRLFLINFMVM